MSKCPISGNKSSKDGETSHCSEECIKGSIHHGQPKGTIEKLHGLDVYITGNRTKPRGLIVLYSDIFGLGLPNNKLLADGYAATGEWLVYLPDFFQGDPVGLKIADLLIPVDAAKQGALSKYTGMLASVPSFLMWSGRHGVEKTDKVFTEFMGAVRRETRGQGLKVGLVGTCWGGKYALRAARRRNMIDVAGVKTPLVDAVVMLHPSNLVLPEDAESLVVPAAFGWGKEDFNTNIATMGKVEGVCAAAGTKAAAEVVHKVYTPGRHGFAVRGNPDDPAERACLEESEKQVLEWMDKWL